ncbi:hypothetical protein [Fodinibius sp. Rm-B-1B1-1]|uniref:hypothetical protein n=1 Tax=Fodinibius alkaliphilus TaxID=3140241 RepID=UPI00315A6D36
MKIFHITLLISCMMLIFGCKKSGVSGSDPTNPSEEPIEIEEDVVAQNKNVNTFEITSLLVNTDFDDKYTATFAGSEVELIKTSDSTLTFIVPNVESGTQSLGFELGEIDYEVNQIVVSNPEETVSDAFVGIDDELSSLSSDTLIDQQEVENTKKLKSEVQELYNSLTSEQKEEVALFYEANKDLFRNFNQNVSKTYNKFSRKSLANSDCPKTNYKTYYPCTASNLGDSFNELGKSLAKTGEWVGYGTAAAYLGSQVWYAGPTSWGLTAIGSTLSFGTAAYLLITEVRPAVLKLKHNLVDFLEANWIFVKAIFLVVTEEYPNETETDMGIDGKFRTIQSSDSEITEETEFFIVSYDQLRSNWNDFTELLGKLPTFESDEEAVELETGDITISNISNSNVNLVSQNGEKVKFESTTGAEEEFSFDITVNKEGFIRSTNVKAKITERDFDLKGQWYFIWYNVDGSISQTELIDFGDGGTGEHLGYNIPSNDNICHSGWHDYSQSFNGTQSYVRLDWYGLYAYYIYDPDNPGRLEVVEGSGNVSKRTALQKNNPGSPC